MTNQFIRIHCIDDTKSARPTIVMHLSVAQIIAIEPVDHKNVEHKTQILTTNGKIVFKVIEDVNDILHRIEGD